MGYKRFCKEPENIENYEAAKKDNFKNWDCHHRLETHTSDGERRLVDITRDELRALGMYYNRPANELIFMKHSEHASLHKPSEETRKKIGEAMKGEKNPFYGKHHSEEIRNKISEAMKGKHHSEETRSKMSEARKGKDNPFYGKHHSEESKKKMSEINKVKMKGMRFFNNGKINIRAKECPPGFVPGMLK